MTTGSRPSPAPSCILDATGDCVDGLRWRLLRPNTLTQAGAASCEDLGRQVLADAGTWTVEIFSDSGALGAYAFTVVPVSSPAATTLTLGEPVNGTISGAGEWHDYRIEAEPGSVVILDATGDCVDGLRWRLLRPNTLTQAGAASCEDLGRQVLADAGTWTVEIFSDSGALGAYAFTVVPVSSPAATTLTLGEPVNGTISGAGEWHDYRIEAEPGSVVMLDATGDCVDGLRWRLLRPNTLTQAGAASCEDLGRQVLADAGTWTVEIFSDSGALGAYAFTVSAAQD